MHLRARRLPEGRATGPVSAPRLEMPMSVRVLMRLVAVAAVLTLPGCLVVSCGP
jgi:hypothetical protein